MPKNELKGIRVCKLEDENGIYYISNTSYYVPQWLRESETSKEDDLPPDSLVVYGAENQPEVPTTCMQKIESSS